MGVCMSVCVKKGVGRVKKGWVGGLASPPPPYQPGNVGIKEGGGGGGEGIRVLGGGGGGDI